MQTSYPPGKLPAEHLAQLLTSYAPSDERVIIGPGVGCDAAVLALDAHADGRCLVAKTDPITFASDEIGWYAVHINANDVACTGATARWFLATLLLPVASANAALADAIFAQIVDACRELDVALVGGHTEITHSIDRAIVVGCMLGEVNAGDLVRSDGAKPGDALLVTKGIAVEGTAIIAREKKEELELSQSLLTQSKGFLYNPGISIVRDAAAATRAGEVHAMHDPTEGGLATGLWEMAEAAGVGLEVDASAIPIFPETQAVCTALGLDPLGLIASGALLLAVAPEDKTAILNALLKEGITAAHIGCVTERKDGTILRSAAGEGALPHFARDEIARLFE